MAIRFAKALFIGLIILIFGVLYIGSQAPNEPETADNLAAREAVLAIFKSENEPTARSAAWASTKLFKISVNDDGSSRNGYAQYACEVIRQLQLSRGYSVEIVDAASVAEDRQLVVLGKADC